MYATRPADWATEDLQHTRHCPLQAANAPEAGPAPLPLPEVVEFAGDVRRAEIRIDCISELRMVEGQLPQSEQDIVDLEFTLMVPGLPRATVLSLALMDVAEHGIGFITSDELILGEQVAIFAAREDVVEPVFQGEFRISSCRSARCGRFVCGARLLTGDMAPLFKALLDSRYLQHLAAISLQQ